MKKYILHCCRIVVCSLLLTICSKAVQPWSFVSLCDNRGAFENYREVLTFINELNHDENQIPIDFIVACGDIDPVMKNYEIYQEILQDPTPLYLPVMGNHEIEDRDDVDAINRALLPKLGDLIVRHDRKHANYCMDWKNSRIIVMDQYSRFGKGNDCGWITDRGIRWMEECIVTATNAAHIFAAVHEPAFPRHRHLRRDGLSPVELQGWQTLVNHRDKVRALLVGHTHSYSRMRVEDPRVAAASTTSLPNEPGGVYQIDTGNAGNTHGKGNEIGFLKVDVNGPQLLFTAYAAKPGTRSFKITDQWTLNAADVKSTGAIPPAISWVSSGNQTLFQPGEVIQRELQAQSLTSTVGAGYTVEWRLQTSSESAPVFVGSSALEMDTRATDTIQDFKIPTSNATPGEVWTLTATLREGERTIETITENVYCVEPFDLSNTWLIQAGDNPAWSQVNIDDSDWSRISTPQAWEDSALPDYDGIAWYRYSFALPEDKLNSWSDQTVGILIGAIDDADELFLNGHLVGSSGKFPPARVTAWDQPRLYTFSADQLSTQNVIAVRVSDWTGGGGIWKGPVTMATQPELELIQKIKQ